MNPKECQQIGCHLDANMDEFEHFAHHRTLLLDIRANIAHEMGLVGRDDILEKDYVLVRGKGYPFPTNFSQQDIGYFCKLSKLKSQNRKLLGGFNINDSVLNLDPSNLLYNGLRLSNFRNDCYLNAAVNSIVTNPILLHEIKGQNQWGR